MNRFNQGRSLEQKPSLTLIEQYKAESPKGDLTPYTLERLSPDQDHTAIIIAKGWTAPPQAYDEFRHELALSSGLPVITYDDPSPRNEFGVPILFRPKKAGDDLTQNMHTVTHDAMRRHGFNRFLLFGHSLGGAVTVNYAHKYGENIDGLVLAAPAGLMLNDDVYAAGKRAMFDHPRKHEVGQVIKKPNFEFELIGRGAVRAVFHWQRTIAQGVFAATEKTTEKIQELTYDGTPVTVVTFEQDAIFSHSSLSEGLVGLNNVDIVELLGKCHNAPVHVPGEVAHDVGRLLVGMAKAA